MTTRKFSHHRNLHLDLNRTLCSPSPRPSPLGRRRIVSSLGASSKHSARSKDRMRDSLYSENGCASPWKSAKRSFSSYRKNSSSVDSPQRGEGIRVRGGVTEVLSVFGALRPPHPSPGPSPRGGERERAREDHSMARTAWRALPCLGFYLSQY